jgi:glycosyltransferase involved in cell wall biosynthesis
VECNGVVWEEYRAKGYPRWFCSIVKLMAWQQTLTTNAVIGVTPAIRDSYCRLAGGVDGYAISNGVFTEKFPIALRQEVRREKGWSEGMTVFVMPSEFAPWHGISDLVAAIDRIPSAERAQMRFVLPGSGGEFDAIHDMVRRKNLGDFVELPGRLGREDIYRLLSAADVGLLFTQASGIPGSSLKLFEYFGAGLLTIACHDGYLGGLVPFYDLGILLPTASPENIAAAVCRATQSHRGEGRRLAIRQIAEKEFHWRQVARRVAAVLRGDTPELERWMCHGEKT